jgi:glycopeptide antibiotics resistance protein
MKTLSKTILALYLITLLWLVLFKFSYDLLPVLLDHQTRSLNLIPFVGALQGNSREMIDNLVIFVPFGPLLGVNFKQISLWGRLTFIYIFSLVVETVQYLFAIGTTDITDVIMNTLGGLAGLVLYDLASKYIDGKKLDRFIVIAGAVLFILLISLRVFVFRVRY